MFEESKRSRDFFSLRLKSVSSHHLCLHENYFDVSDNNKFSRYRRLDN